MISLSEAVRVILYLVIGGVIFWLLYWLVNSEKTAPPEPFKKVANVILAVLAVMVIIGVLLSFIGGQPIFRP